MAYKLYNPRILGQFISHGQSSFLKASFEIELGQDSLFNKSIQKNSSNFFHITSGLKSVYAIVQEIWVTLM
jgi:hypothetical protein